MQITSDGLIVLRKDYKWWLDLYPNPPGNNVQNAQESGIAAFWQNSDYSDVTKGGNIYWEVKKFTQNVFYEAKKSSALFFFITQMNTGFENTLNMHPFLYCINLKLLIFHAQQLLKL